MNVEEDSEPLKGTFERGKIFLMEESRDEVKAECEGHSREPPSWISVAFEPVFHRVPMETSVGSFGGIFCGSNLSLTLAVSRARRQLRRISVGRLGSAPRRC